MLAAGRAAEPVLAISGASCRIEARVKNAHVGPTKLTLTEKINNDTCRGRPPTHR